MDPALASIATAVHFLDIGGIPVPDAKGLETMLKGARETARNDDALLADSMRTFDLLYSGYRSGHASIRPRAVRYKATRAGSKVP